MTAPKHLYIHIPFCTNKCYYCDFNIFVWQGDDWVWQYLQALEREMARTVEWVPPQELETIYIGGGTPSLLDERQLERLLQLVDRYFPRRSGKLEFSLEANPGTLTLEKFRILKAMGVNRLSIGIQTFNDALLRQIGRRHTREDAVQSVELARRAGFANISIDLMIGLPGQTLADVQDSLTMIQRLGVDHVSAYSLKVEERTLFDRWLQEGRLQLPPEELEVEMYWTVVDGLADLGLYQYEISNFARPGKASHHNRAYWLNRDYYGIGAGAHGYIQGVRHENIGPLRPYMRATEQGLPRAHTYEVSPQERMEEMMFLGLRLTEGVSYARFEAEWGRSMLEVYGEEIAELRAQGLLIQDEEGIRLSRKGMLLGNEVFARFIKEKN